jgi:4-amino-4-deoxy-L-arabinose transferase-like glycosyltransferase
MQNVNDKKSTRIPWIAIAIPIILLLFGVGLRLYDLTDPPIDFHPTRQLRNAIVARGVYYTIDPDADPSARELARSFMDSTGKYEPPLLENLVGFTYYIVGSEYLWISRIYTTIFWIIGGIAVYVLAYRMAKEHLVHSPISPTAYLAASISLAYYMVLPFGVQASRSFQPDPGMVMLVTLCILFLYLWSDSQKWSWAVLAGLAGGFAILTKAVAGYVIAGGAIAVVFQTFGWKHIFRKAQVWAMAGLMLAPTLIFYSGQSGRAAEYFSNWTLALSHLLLQPGTYVRWFNFVQNLFGLTVLLLALIGIFIAKPRDRTLLLGLLVGYFVYGLTLPYQMYTHNYYHLVLVPIISIALLPLSILVIRKILDLDPVWKFATGIAALAFLLFSAWIAILPMHAEDFHTESSYWQEIASQLPEEGKILALTQDYGYRLMYFGWRKVNLWPNRAEQKLMDLRGNDKEFESYFEKKAADASFFVVTSFNQFNDQPELKKHLYENFPVISEQDDYLIFDLYGKQ